LDVDGLGKKVFSLVIFAFLCFGMLTLGFQAHALTPLRQLSVHSLRGGASPPEGEHWLADGSNVTCTVSPPAPNSTVWCSGWIGTGSVPPNGNELSVTFTITEDSTILWIWKSIDSPNFGKPSVGFDSDGIYHYSNLCQYFYGTRFQAPEDCFAQNITLYVDGNVDGERAPKVAIYNDSAGKPSTLLAQGATTVRQSNMDWVTVGLSTQPNLFSGNYYWLVANAVTPGEVLRFYYIMNDTWASRYNYDDTQHVAETNQSVYGSTTLASFPTDTCVYSGFRTRVYSIYCNYEPERYNNLTFGNSNVGSSYTNLCQYQYGSRYYLDAPVNTQWISSISLYLQEMNGENRPLQVAIYSDDGAAYGAPGDAGPLQVSVTSIVPAGFVGWFNISIPPYFGITGGNFYWVVADAVASGKNLRFYYGSGFANQAGYRVGSYVNFPTHPMFTFDGFRPRAYNIYCTYCDPFYFRR
jgi:hypothetical protein